MAGLNTSEDLRREIQVLAAENEELKQLVQLLMENQDLKQGLRSNDPSVLSQLYESTRQDSTDRSSMDSGSFRVPLRLPPRTSTPQQYSTPPPMSPMGMPRPPFMGQQFSTSSRLDSTSFSPHTPRSPHTPAGGMSTPPAGMFTPPGGMSTPPGGMVTPPGGMFTPSPVAIGGVPQAPRGQRMQQFQFPGHMGPPPVARLNLQSPNLLRSPASPDSGLLGAAYLSADSIDVSNRSGGRLRGRGYCIECANPWHPHLIYQDSLADSAISGRMNQSGSSSDDSSFG